MKGHRKAAAAINQKIERQAGRIQRKRQLAEVRGVKPLKLAPLDLEYALDDDDVTLSQAVESYDEDEGLAVGDNVIVDQVGGGWVATDVVSKKKAPSMKTLKERLDDLEARIEALE